MNITITINGLVRRRCLADLGNGGCCLYPDPVKITSGRVPIREPGLSALIQSDGGGLKAAIGAPSAVSANGQQAPSFRYVSDFIEGHLRLLEIGPDIVGPDYPGNHSVLTAHQLLGSIFKLSGPASNIVTPLPNDDGLQRQLHLTLARDAIGLDHSVPLHDGFVHAIADFDQLQSRI